MLRKTALITGASGGIGRATARLLAQSGADLILHGHTGGASLDSLVVELKSHRPTANITAVYGDLSLKAEQDRLMADMSNLCSVPDVLVLAAGCDLMSAAMKQLSFEERFAKLWQIDVVSALRLSRFFGERMKKRLRDQASSANTEAQRESQGVIIFFGWDGVEHGMSGETAQLYAAAKGAVQGFSRSLARSLAPEVRVNCAAPGWIKTTWGETASPATDERLAAESLARRWGTAEDVAQLVQFLISDAAAYINNQTVFVNGGRE
ncbi:MAG: SDR family oxidoreductase [Planctomycetaceae bacterium]|nr:SDR family oxidoreductase [Planctomycetaceae bacterium]